MIHWTTSANHMILYLLSQRVSKYAVSCWWSNEALNIRFKYSERHSQRNLFLFERWSSKRLPRLKSDEHVEGKEKPQVRMDYVVWSRLCDQEKISGRRETSSSYINAWPSRANSSEKSFLSLAWKQTFVVYYWLLCPKPCVPLATAPLLNVWWQAHRTNDGFIDWRADRRLCKIFLHIIASKHKTHLDVFGDDCFTSFRLLKSLLNKAMAVYYLRLTWFIF